VRFFRNEKELNCVFIFLMHDMCRLLLLGADPNQKSRSSMSPLISVCVAYGPCSRTRTSVISELIACGANPSVDRIQFSATGSGNSSNLPLRLEEGTRRTLSEICVEPRRLQVLAACVVRKCLAEAEFNGVIKNTDHLPLLSALKSVLKLEFNNM